MGTLQLRNGSYRILFCSRDRRHSFTLGRVDRREAELATANVERLLLRIDQSLLAVPLHHDIVGFVRRDGRPAPADLSSSDRPRRRPSGSDELRNPSPRVLLCPTR
jgi:hypothetical protein